MTIANSNPVFSELVLAFQPGKKHPFRVAVDFYWRDKVRRDEIRHMVPANSETDLASIPVGLRNVFNRLGPGIPAAVIHDDLYKRRAYTRKRCDEMFYEALRDCGLPKWKAKPYYWGVRLGGAVAIGDDW